ncbi:DGQHR domain-containing protein [Janthinobacterium sp. PAMC25594]|uniref:DGQHR domain-containing protein n=1 Tax=Janthinobacterium sp. PAMC25594 TaxID=2861284 RepID=UPI001C63511C|nr:DGQHR domain-containing protein [Janthinobacterium sp. PAMC25594]QYG05646.1 DGQHR domain-containing protein [Janthinobacterium sp. PAMC25594]
MATAKKKDTAISYPCLLISQNNHRFYLTSIPVADIFKYCFVSTRDDDNLQGFQRQLSKPRADDIAKYLDQGVGSIPTNIVLSAQEDAKLKYNARNKAISFERLDKSFLVLDGQHRLWGYQICLERFKKDHRVPLSIYENLSRTEETRLFIDINTKQVGVPAALLLDIKQLAQIEGERDTTLRELFDGVKKTPNLNFSGLLSPSKSVVGKVSRVTFNRAVGQALDSSVLQGLDKKKKLTLLINYIKAFENVLDDQKLLTRSAFLEAIFDVFEQAVRQSLLSYKNAKTESIQKVISPIAKYSYGDSTLRSVGQVKKAVRSALAGSISIAPNML